jgi:hypothetical protein
VRFEATVLPGASRDLDLIDTIDVFQLPSVGGRVRILATPDELSRVLDLGLEVQVHRAYPVRPLSPTLIQSDEAVQEWLADWPREVGRGPGGQGS